MAPTIRARKHASRRPATVAAMLLAAATAIVAGLVVPAGGSAKSQAPPASTGEPAISGNPVVGSTLSASRGSWSGNPTSYSYQWVRCPASGGRPDGSDCATIGGATTSRYIVQQDDVNQRLRVRVTASNADGAATAASNATPRIREAPATGEPRNTQLPTIAGTAAVGNILRASPGTWAGRQPITFSFQWLRCDQNGNSCLTLSGYTDDSYSPRDGDIGRTLRVRVTARNDAGTSSALSNRFGLVQGPTGPPGAVKLPSGETSIPVTSVPCDGRLIVDRVEFTPNVVRTRSQPITVRIKVKDTRGNVVRDALVFLRSTPLTTSTPTRGRTGQDGWIQYTVQPEVDFVIRNGYSTQFFVKAYREGDPALGGVGGYRLVQVRTAR
jgi:hypothetical protein